MHIAALYRTTRDSVVGFVPMALAVDLAKDLRIEAILWIEYFRTAYEHATPHPPNALWFRRNDCGTY